MKNNILGMKQAVRMIDECECKATPKRYTSKLPLLVSTSLSLLGGFGYFQRAYGQTVLSGSLSTYNADPVQLQGPGLFETSPNFSVDTTNSQNFGGDDAIVITSTGTSSTDSLTFRDISAGQITSSYNDGIDADVAYGSLTITTNSVINAGRRGLLVNHGSGQSATTNATSLSITANQINAEYGIKASHLGAGDVSITVTGDIVATDYKGIRLDSSNTVTANRNITISAQNIISDDDAISVRSRYAQDASISVTVNGDISAGNGGYGHGVWAYAYGPNENAVIDITTYGSITSYNHGIKAYNDVSGGDITIHAMGDISITGGYYSGIYVTNTGDNIDITVHGITASGYGVYAKNYGAGHLIINSYGTIAAAYEGIFAENNGDGNTEIRVHGDIAGQENGVSVYNNGLGTLIITSDGTITGARQGDSGIVATSFVGDTTIAVNNVSGQEHGISLVQFDDSVSIDVAGAVTGDDGDGIDFRARGTADLTITIAEGGSVSTAGADAANDFAIDARADQGVAMTINNAGTVTGQVSLNNVGSNLDSANLFTNTGTWNLAGTASNFSANAESAVVNFGLVIAAGDAATAETSLIDNLDTFRNNVGGAVRLADGAAGDVFRIGASTSGDGNFVANGGTVELDVVLGGDGSVADRLQIDGDVLLDTAPTTLAITSVGGGTGGETVTGIELVRVDGTSAAGAFVLANPVEVGALAYSLSQGQCDATGNENWYLCNSGAIGTTGALFESMTSIVLNSFVRTEALQVRLGERVQGVTGTTNSARGNVDWPLAQSLGPWFRTWGQFAEITPNNSSAGSSWEADSWGLEAGIGAILGNHEGGRLVGGVNLRYGATYADLINPLGSASLDAEGFGIASSLTWFGNDGLYLDGNAAVDFVSINATSQGGGVLLNDYDSVVYSVSAEVGKRLELKGGTTLVPQAQLSWGRMRDDSLTDNLGNMVSFANQETLTSRVGLTVEQDITNTEWSSTKIFGFGNLLNDTAGSRTATVAGTEVTQSGTGDWLELGGGFSLQPSENSNLFGTVSYRQAFNGVDGDEIAVSAGWRMQW